VYIYIILLYIYYIIIYIISDSLADVVQEGVNVLPDFQMWSSRFSIAPHPDYSSRGRQQRDGAEVERKEHPAELTFCR